MGHRQQRLRDVNNFGTIGHRRQDRNVSRVHPSFRVWEAELYEHSTKPFAEYPHWELLVSTQQRRRSHNGERERLL